MKSTVVCKILILSSSLVSLYAYADTAEIQRLKGFAEHQREQVQFDKGRERGEQEFLEEQEQWERQKQLDLADYRKRKKAAEVDDNGPEAREEERVQKLLAEEQEVARKEYSKNRQRFDRDSQKGLVSELEELDIYSNRPRYAQKDRVLYGAQAKYTPPSSRSSGGGSSSGGGYSPPPSFNNHSNSSPFPPPPSFDEFNDGGGFPPPADGYGNGDFGGDDFPPPPPPPPPMGGDFDFPPPPSGEDFGF